MNQQFDLLFYRGTGLISREIEYMSKGQYSHVAMFLDSFHTLETGWYNPNVIKHLNYKRNEYDVYKLKVPLDDGKKEIILNYIIKHIEIRYDFIYLISRGLHLLFGTKVINPKKYFTCDELIVDAFKEAGIKLIDVDENLSPSTLAKSKYLVKIT